MPRAPGRSRRPRAEAGSPRNTVGSHLPEAPARSLSPGTPGTGRSLLHESAVAQEVAVAEPPAHVEQAASRETGETPHAPRFRIFIVDTGWNSPAHKILHENFALIRDLQKDEEIYVLSREKSIEVARRYGSRIGRDPIIAVHDLAALDKDGTAGFHGFRLCLGLLRTPEQALLGLQAFTRFLATHRRSTNLEGVIRSELRHEGFQGAIEIIMHHEARQIGNDE
jgi:hypothetical protein